MNTLHRSINVLHRGQASALASTVRRSSAIPVTAIMVKELRERSGAPMMDCKKALSDAAVSGDIEKAMNWLRMKGIARSSQGERISQEGLIAFLYTTNVCTLIEVNSETDFVGKNEKFHSFVAMLAGVCNRTMPSDGAIDVTTLLKESSGEGYATGETIAESLGDIVSQIRENIVIRRAVNISTPTSSSVLAGYVHGRVGIDSLPQHIMMGKTAALVRLEIAGESGSAKELVLEMGKKLAMHVVAASPSYLQPDQVPATTIATETALFRQQSEEAMALKASTSSKSREVSPEMMEKIIQGKVSKRMSDICLLNQAHVAEEGAPVVSKFLENYGKQIGVVISVPYFHRWTLGQTN